MFPASSARHPAHEHADTTWQDHNLVFCLEDSNPYTRGALNWRFSKVTRCAGIGHWRAQSRASAIILATPSGPGPESGSPTLAIRFLLGGLGAERNASRGDGAGYPAWAASGDSRPRASRSARLSALGTRNCPAMPLTRSAASATVIPAAVT